MDQIRKLVSAKFSPGRLNGAAGGPHPDADLLSAFAERALPDAERDRVLQHLGNCGECREILYLAMPDSQQQQKVLSFPARVSRGWGLRWGAVAASVVVIAALAGSRYQAHKTMKQFSGAYGKLAEEKTPADLEGLRDARVQGQDQDARVNDKKAAASPTETRSEARALPQAKHMTAKPLNALEFDKSDQVRVTSESGAASGYIAGNLPLARSRTDSPVAGAADMLAAAPGQSPAPMKGKLEQPKTANESVEVSATGGAVADVKDKATEVAMDQNASQDVSKLAVRKEGTKNDELNAAPTKAVAQRQTANQYAYSTEAETIADPLRWKVSRQGALQRSVDSGRSWQAISVASGAVFRVLWVSGSNVWAGGNAGVLYHSADSGLNWTRVELVSGEQKLESDIKHIDFSDSLNGTLTASHGEIWHTSDGGLTWQRK